MLESVLGLENYARLDYSSLVDPIMKERVGTSRKVLAFSEACGSTP